MAMYSESPLPLPSPHQTDHKNRIESNPPHLAAAADACSTGRSPARMSYAYLFNYIIIGDTGASPLTSPLIPMMAGKTMTYFMLSHPKIKSKNAEVLLTLQVICLYIMLHKDHLG
ncbi:hypothetical protein EJB05_08582, partial [Eragrostis curvula]